MSTTALRQGMDQEAARMAGLTLQIDPSQWRRAERLFATSLQQPDDERSAFLRRVCGNDSGLHQAVLRLLKRDQETTCFLDSTAVVPNGPRPRSPRRMGRSRWIGRRLGAYRLMQRIGTGGMSQVFSAKRVADDIDLHVAVKIIGERVESATLLRSLQRERQILARLSHPHIVRFFDAGTTPEGLPYVVLELVDGMPLTTYCDIARFTLKQRLELFCKICDAVHYAHGQLVIHRDLKPSNILVTDDGEPKLLDFGIAKRLDHLRAIEELTQLGVRCLTPHYASPEQLSGEPISAASDIFSLGVVLYQLLTGLRPREVQEAMSNPSPEFPPPSQVVSLEPCSGASRRFMTPAARSAQRGVSPSQLEHQLLGDLDQIVLRCLQQSPAERYPDVRELMEDVQRYLEGQAIDAEAAPRGPLRSRHVLPRNWKIRWSVLAVLALLASGAWLLWA